MPVVSRACLFNPSRIPAEVKQGRSEGPLRDDARNEFQASDNRFHCVDGIRRTVQRRPIMFMPLPCRDTDVAIVRGPASVQPAMDVAISQRLLAALYQEGAIMLVLSRQRDEVIKIGDDIEITVVDIRGDKVRLGITAPKEVQVHRKEVYEAIRRENRAAAQVTPEDVASLKFVPKTGPREEKK
jgi:carbon storage regulator